MDHGLEKEQRATIIEVSRLLADSGVDHWLFGGWAVDYHLGRVTRAHKDIDFVVGVGDRSAIRDVLGGAGFEPRDADDPDAGEFFDRGVVRIELTFIVSRPDGSTVTPGYEHWPWDEGSFGEDRCRLDGEMVPVISVAGLIAVKRGWERHLGEQPRAHDVIDMALLAELPGATP